MACRPIALIALVSLLCSCASPPAKHIYLLNEPLAPATDAEAAVGTSVLLLKHVMVPDYLDTTDIRVRVGQHELQSSSTARWAERLSLGVTHALQADLAARLPRYSVKLSGPAEESAAVVLVTVDRFEVWPDGHCMLAASWTILEGNARTVLTTDRDSISVPPVVGSHSQDDKVIAGMAGAIGRLAVSIASSVSGVRR